MSSRESMFARAPAAADACEASAAPTVLVVDDHAALREGVLRLLQETATTWGEVVAVGSLEEARRAAARLQPDLVVLDVDLAGDDGLQLIPSLPATCRVLVLSSHGDTLTRERALRMGAAALVDKHEAATELLAAIGRLAAPGMRGDQAPGCIGTWVRWRA